MIRPRVAKTAFLLAPGVVLEGKIKKRYRGNAGAMPRHCPGINPALIRQCQKEIEIELELELKIEIKITNITTLHGAGFACACFDVLEAATARLRGHA